MSITSQAQSEETDRRHLGMDRLHTLRTTDPRTSLLIYEGPDLDWLLDKGLSIKLDWHQLFENFELKKNCIQYIVLPLLESSGSRLHPIRIQRMKTATD